jgi:carbon-monoxide dehydrogenase medium subunit
MSEQLHYIRPRTVADAVAALAADGDGAVPLAGGTDLLVQMRGGDRSVRTLVDIKAIPDLHELHVDAGEIHIGAAISLRALAEDPDIGATLPALVRAARSIGTTQVRSRATLLGNLCNASPAADTAPVLLALDAQILVEGSAGSRTIPLHQWFTGVKRTALARGELAVGVRVPRPAPGTRMGFARQGRIRGHDLAIVNVAAVLDAGRRSLRIAIGSCAPTPLLLPALEFDTLEADPMDALLDAAEGAVCPISDLRGSAAYRRAILAALLRRLYGGLLTEEGRDRCTASN